MEKIVLDQELFKLTGRKRYTITNFEEFKDSVATNGCGVRFLDVPEFHFHKSCNMHDIMCVLYDEGTLDNSWSKISYAFLKNMFDDIKQYYFRKTAKHNSLRYKLFYKFKQCQLTTYASIYFVGVELYGVVKQIKRRVYL